MVHINCISLYADHDEANLGRHRISYARVCVEVDAPKMLIINFVKVTHISYVLVEINYIELSLFWEKLLKKLYM